MDDPTPGGANTSDPNRLIDDNDSNRLTNGDDNLSRDGLGIQFPGVFAANQDTSITVKVGADGIATLENGGDIEFTVGMQPGDNYRIAVALQQEDINALHIHSNNQTGYIKPSDEQPFGFNGVVSPMLTVWRHLWSEFDSMGPPPQSGAEKNFDEGTIDGYTVLPGGLAKLNLSTRLTDEANRYEEGKMYIVGFEPFIVISNTDNLVFDDDVVIQGTPGNGVIGKAFQIFDDDIVPLGSRQPYSLPYRLSGGSLIYTAYADAYIEPIMAPEQYIQNDVPFRRNLGPGLSWSYFVSQYKNLPNAADFWSAHLLAAWQPDATGDDSDYDPSATGNQTYLLGLAQDWGNFGAIYVEVNREWEVYSANPRIQEEHTVVHEIGHEGGGEHDDGGIMAGGSPVRIGTGAGRWNDKFEPITIRRFRVDASY